MSKTEKERMADLLNGAINVVHAEHEDVNKKDIKKLFSYLTNYCKIVQHGEIPFAVYKSSQPCSIFYIRNRINDFLEHHASTYRRMPTKDIIKAMVGTQKYEEALESIGSEKSTSTTSLGSPRSFKGRLSDVDGGGKKKKKTMQRKRGTKRRVNSKTRKCK